MALGDVHEPKVTLHKAVAMATEVQQNLALENEERLFEGVDMALDLRPGAVLYDRDAQMHRPVLRPEVLSNRHAICRLAGVPGHELQAAASKHFGMTSSWVCHGVLRH
jgi:hypothetical protein